jgi:hypothetical protein
MLYSVVHRVSSPRFFAKDSTLAAAFDLDIKTFRKAIKNLIGCRLLRSTPAARGGKLSEYWLCHPVTGEPLPEEAGRATPTFNGFRTLAMAAEQKATSSSATSQGVPHIDEGGVAKRRVPTTRGNGSGIVSTQPYETPQPTAKGANPLCRIAGHNLVHYRKDGSPICGNCHPTGKTEPPSTNTASTSFTQPTARDLGFYGDDDPGDDVPF